MNTATLLLAAQHATHAVAQPNADSPNCSIRLGGPVDSPPDDPEELARAHRDRGYRAAYCPEVDINDTSRMRAFAEAFAKHDVVIAEVGRWCNLLDPDPAQRRANLDTVAQGLALADEIGARCCVDIAGSYNAETWFGPHPDNFSDDFFNAAIENARTIIDAVKPKRAKFCYEMMGWAIPHTPDVYLRLHKAVDRDGFGAHLDPCNLVNSPQTFYRNSDLINECFDKLGPLIVSAHAKDLVWEIEFNVHFREVRPGAGQMDYKTYLQRLAQLPQQPPLMLEHLDTAEEYDAARKHLHEFGPTVGVSFG